jgi:hypothetical protein
MALLPIGAALGILAGGLLHQAVFGGYRPLFILLGSFAGAAVAGWILIYRAPHQRLVTKALKRWELAIALPAFGLLIALLLGYNWLIVTRHAMGADWVAAWLVVTRPLIDVVAWVIPEIAWYPARLRELGVGARADLIQHVYSVGWALALALFTAIATNATQTLFRDEDGAISRGQKTKAFIAGGLILAILSAMILYTIGAVDWVERAQAGAMADRGHRDDGSLIAHATLSPVAGAALWWFLLAAVVHLVRLSGCRCASPAETSDGPAHPQRSAEGA